MTPERLRSLRAALGVTQDSLARALGVTPTAVAHWEAGHRRPSGPARRLLTLLEQGAIDLAALRRAAREDE